MVFVSTPSPKRRFPLPATTGATLIRYSSTRSCPISACTSLPLASSRMSPPGFCFSLATPSATLFLMSVELLHASGSSRVAEATYLGRPFILSAMPSSLAAVGQNSANSSYVALPSSRALLPSSSSCADFDSSSLQNWKNHLSGASMTPSSATFVDTITFLTISSFVGFCILDPALLDQDGVPPVRFARPYRDPVAPPA